MAEIFKIAMAAISTSRPAVLGGNARSEVKA
jgi:hypothetical protein